MRADVLAAIQELPQGSFELAQSALIVHPTKEPVLILQDPFGKGLADELAQKEQRLIKEYPNGGFKRHGKGQEGSGIACGSRWSGQDGYQE